MFWEKENVEKIADGIWIYKNFVSKEKVEEINGIMERYKTFKSVPNHSGGTLYEDMLIDWYQEKTSPMITELYPVWCQMSELLGPEYQIHPQLSMLVTRPGDTMFIHSDSPGEEMNEDLTVEDRWNTCCVLQYGAVVYFGEFEGGEVFYPHINKDGVFEGGQTPLKEGRELRVSPQPGDLVIHGALSNHAHGVHEITKGYRYAFSNFVLPASKNPGTFPAYGTKENDERWQAGWEEWTKPIGFKWEPSESLKEEIAQGINYVRYK
jgi:hypothetical protein